MINNRLATRFLLAVIGLFVAVSIGSTLFLLLESRHIVEQLGSSYAIERAKAARSRIENLVNRETALAVKLADSPTVKRWMAAEESQTRRRLAMAELESFKVSFLDSNYFVVVHDSLHYYNQPADGELAVTTLDRSATSDQWYFARIKNDAPVTFNLDQNVFMGSTRLWINALVVENGTVLGLAGTGLNLGGLVSTLIEDQEDGAQVVLTDGDGVIQAHPDQSIMEHNARADSTEERITVYDRAADEEARSALKELSREADSGGVSVGTIARNGGQRLMAATALPTMGWQMFVSVDASRFISVSSFTPLFLLLLGSVLVAFVVIGLLLQRSVLQPLSAMTQSARRIASGSYDVPLPSQRRDEIGELATAFSDMATQVKHYTEELESLVDQRTAELSESNEKLKAANQQVNESFRYARLMQDGVMPSEATVAERVSSYSLFHRQRDIVGGDSLYLCDLTGGFLIATIDCEGHGVSGALMTMMADSFLHLITAERDSDDPAAILTKLDHAIGSSIEQSQTQPHVTGGMEIGLCACYPASGTVLYSGAGMPLYVSEPDGTVRTIQDRRKSLSYSYRREPEPFTLQRFDTRGRAFFLVTDGYVDQPGGEDGRAFGTTRLAAMLARCGTEALSASNPAWEREFDDYRGNQSQRDDVLAIGFTL